MERISLDPIQRLKPIDSLNRNNDSDKASGLGFKEMFQDVVQNVKETEEATKIDAYNLSIGNMDDLHTMMINAAKAEIALQTMVQIRNKVLDAYSEIMRINI
ncbi:MAG: flagellar hook-basal body complex protein FliE [Clostridiales bacterium]|jgi:flagellar hook-basal body complex protein FliE|nr:flagellar hook-basal body complex protein FliE [Clostridiales bacterium]